MVLRAASLFFLPAIPHLRCGTLITDGLSRQLLLIRPNLDVSINHVSPTGGNVITAFLSIVYPKIDQGSEQLKLRKK